MGNEEENFIKTYTKDVYIVYIDSEPTFYINCKNITRIKAEDDNYYLAFGNDGLILIKKEDGYMAAYTKIKGECPFEHFNYFNISEIKKPRSYKCFVNSDFIPNIIYEDDTVEEFVNRHGKHCRLSFKEFKDKVEMTIYAGQMSNAKERTFILKLKKKGNGK